MSIKRLATVVGSGAVIVAAMVSLTVAPANADEDKFVAISYSPDNGAYGWGNNYATLDEATNRSLSECQNFGGTNCARVAWAKNQCAALAVDDDSYYGWYGRNRIEADAQALVKNHGGRILVSRCSTGDEGIG
jgi:Domain of unknown function (DUF4189)